jgi:putative FmdB family regulatory protein
MPTYGYQCGRCAHKFEVRQSMSDAPLKDCPECGGELRKLLYPVGVQFKGSGFYTTDYGRKGDGNGEGKGDGKTEGKGDGKSEGKSDSKTDGSKTSATGADKSSASGSSSKGSESGTGSGGSSEKKKEPAGNKE